MKTAILAVSQSGAELAARLEPLLPGAKTFVFSRYAAPGQGTFESIAEMTAALWNEYEGLVFLCASGIAVRSIAPLADSKYRDPAVVVCPDNGAFAISLLSGHEGGANGLAEEIAACIGAVPVISTASEKSPPILPRSLVAGIGCRRGTEFPALKHALETVFRENGLSPLRIRGIASIGIKRDEAGLLHLADSIGAEIRFFSAEELEKAEGVFSASSFVKEITGTDNVCERAAFLASEGGKIIVPKTVMDGITVAVCEKTPGGI